MKHLKPAANCRYCCCCQIHTRICVDKGQALAFPQIDYRVIRSPCRQENRKQQGGHSRFYNILLSDSNRGSVWNDARQDGVLTFLPALRCTALRCVALHTELEHVDVDVHCLTAILRSGLRSRPAKTFLVDLCDGFENIYICTCAVKLNATCWRAHHLIDATYPLMRRTLTYPTGPFENPHAQPLPNLASDTHVYSDKTAFERLPPTTCLHIYTCIQSQTKLQTPHEINHVLTCSSTA